jgi:dimethylhistidine N-methyltransferase
MMRALPLARPERAVARRFDPARAPSCAVCPIDSPFKRDVLAGLSRPQRSVPCKWLYDRRGSELFEAITRLPEYYPTRSEIAILTRCLPRVAEAIGPDATVVELGSGSCEKTRPLLAALHRPRAYVPIDLCDNVLSESVGPLQAAFPRLAIHPLLGDIGDPASLLRLRKVGPTPQGGRRIGFFPGSTIGNFDGDAATALLARLGHVLGADSMLLIGVDSTQDRTRLLPAYNDRAGVTAAFNRNLLVRINRELEGNFDPAAFEHEARFNALLRRVEMHLVCRRWRTFEVCGRDFVFAAGESIHTENSYKYTHARFQSLVESAGWRALNSWTDGSSDFVVHLLERAAASRAHA